jgi:putative transmembrane protein
MMNNLNGAISAVVHATGIMRKYQLISSVTVLSSIPLAYFGLQLGLCPEFALWMVFLSMTLAQIAALVILKGLIEYSIKDYITKVLCPITFVIISTIWIPYIIKSNIELGFMRFFIEGVTSVLAVCISVYFLGLNNTEKNLIKSMVTSARHK